jgi:hypothetical protein
MNKLFLAVNAPPKLPYHSPTSLIKTLLKTNSIIPSQECIIKQQMIFTTKTGIFGRSNFIRAFGVVSKTVSASGIATQTLVLGYFILFALPLNAQLPTQTCVVHGQYNGV